MENEDSVLLERFLNYNRSRVHQLRTSRKNRWMFLVKPSFRKMYSKCVETNTPKRENELLAELLNKYDESWFGKLKKLWLCFKEGVSVYFRQFGKRKTIDYSDKKAKDYYSVAVILKNEARNLKEYILFYMATGADRIYIYDNDSTDEILSVLEPFLKTGFVVYRKWPGHTVQTAAYRDAVRRTRRRTKWLALIDSDEFLFSPKGLMPEQLRAYEQYPGIGVNWLMYGPNGHIQRPKGLVMDSYTSTFADYNAGLNLHIKSIVQPKEVLCVFHTHFPYYRGKQYAVGEDCVPLDNRSTRAFSLKNNRQVFRINHYVTRSLEDLREKCNRGYANGAPNAGYEDLLHQLDYPQTEDYSIKPYADIVRQKYEEY